MEGVPGARRTPAPSLLQRATPALEPGVLPWKDTLSNAGPQPMVIFYMVPVSVQKCKQRSTSSASWEHWE